MEHFLVTKDKPVSEWRRVIFSDSEGTSDYCAAQDFGDNHFKDLRSGVKIIYCRPIEELGTNGMDTSSIRNVAGGQMVLDSSKLLGRGSKTFVYEGKFQERNVAIKRIPCDDPQQIKEYMNAFKSLLGFEKHVNIVDIYGCFLEFDIEEIFVPMEPCKGNLNQWRNGKIADIQVEYDCFPALHLLMDITEGVKFLHGKNIIHGDLKPSNILVSQIENRITLKLADFGVKVSLAKRMEWLAPEMFRNRIRTSVSRKAKLNYMQMSSKSDIFSMGLIFYWILTDWKHPFGEDFIDRESNLSKYRIKIEEKHFKTQYLDELKLLKKMLALNQEDRPSINEVAFQLTHSSAEICEGTER